MGIYIGTVENPVTVNIAGGYTTDEGYIRLTGEYYFKEPEVVGGAGRLTVSIAVFKNKQATVPTPCVDIGQASMLSMQATVAEMAAGDMFTVVVPKVIEKLEELCPAWTDKLVADF